MGLDILGFGDFGVWRFGDLGVQGEDGAGLDVPFTLKSRSPKSHSVMGRSCGFCGLGLLGFEVRTGLSLMSPLPQNWGPQNATWNDGEKLWAWVFWGLGVLEVWGLGFGDQR